MTGTTGKATAHALTLEAAVRRVNDLEYSLKVYRDHPAAAARIADQLDTAYLTLLRLERGEVAA